MRSEKIGEDLTNLPSGGVHAHPIVVHVHVGIIGDACCSLVDRCSRRSDRAEVLAKNGLDLPADRPLETVAQALHLLVERLHLLVDGFHLLVEGFHIDVQALELLVDGLHVDVDRLEFPIERLHFGVDGLHLFVEGRHVDVDPLDSLHLLFQLLVDLALNLFQGAVVDVDLETLQLRFELLHLHLEGRHVDLDLFHALDEGLHPGLDLLDGFVVNLDRDVLDHLDLGIELDLEGLDTLEVRFQPHLDLIHLVDDLLELRAGRTRGSVGEVHRCDGGDQRGHQNCGRQ